MALVKTTTYGIMHMTVAIAVAYALSGSWAIALSIGLLEPVVQTFFYHLHENLWKKLYPAHPSPGASDATTPLLHSH